MNTQAGQTNPKSNAKSTGVWIKLHLNQVKSSEEHEKNHENIVTVNYNDCQKKHIEQKDQKEK